MGARAQVSPAAPGGEQSELVAGEHTQCQPKGRIRWRIFKGPGMERESVGNRFRLLLPKGILKAAQSCRLSSRPPRSWSPLGGRESSLPSPTLKTNVNKQNRTAHPLEPPKSTWQPPSPGTHPTHLAAPGSLSSQATAGTTVPVFHRHRFLNRACVRFAQNWPLGSIPRKS